MMNLNIKVTHVRAEKLRRTDCLVPEALDATDKRLKTFTKRIRADARSLPALSADLVVTSPPYWLKRNYGLKDQIGQEPTANEYVQSLIECMENWKRILPTWGSVFINIGDTYFKGSLAGTPARLEVAAEDAGWILRNRIVWVKEGGLPDPARDRLKSRHEYIFHFVRKKDYYYDQFGYAEKYGNGNSPTDVWTIALRRDTSNHLAPFPSELVDRILTLACPHEVCTACGKPRRRIVRRTAQLDPNRPQARRAMELAVEKKLTPAHIAAIQATGISDAGKAMRVQTGTGRNSAKVKRLAAEAKKALGGYFREFTFAQRRSVGPSTQNQPGRFLQLKRALARLDGISSPIAGEFSPHSIARYLRRLPQYHEYYGEALLLSQLILEGAGLSIRATGALLALPSILIDMEKVFEAYARLILSRKISVEGIMYVRDGNKAGADGAKTTIFTHCQVSNNPSCTPDIVITNPECPTLIIDAKYKPSREIPDRSDLNQVVLYGARYSCSKVMVLFPERKKQEPSAKLLGTIGPVSIYTGYIDLGAPDIEAEEDRFASAIIDILR